MSAAEPQGETKGAAAAASTFGSSDVDSSPGMLNFSREEEAVAAYWEEIDAFMTSRKLNQDKPPFTFYDGPPFATGLPHYGHILAGSIKDAITRYAHMKGHDVERRFGWDTHGLPVEYEIDKKLGITGPEDVAKMGIAAYNAECRSIVTRYCKEWRSIITRLGRWIDFDNDYKTLEPWYMESVWWVFKQIWEKGLVYQGVKVMPYSTACNTPLSNFEAQQNYKEDVPDPAVVVSFPVTTEGSPFQGAEFLAWTTTPWTLPSNLALCVHPELDYVVLKDLSGKFDKDGGNRRFIIGKTRINELYPKYGKKGFKAQGKFEILAEAKGAELGGLTYEPLFPYFQHRAATGSFKVCVDTYVTDGDGTCVVHQAPAFGEDDYRVCLAHEVITKAEKIPCPLDASGRFTDEVPDVVGIYIKDADKQLMEMLKKRGRLIKKGTIKHNYPYCWRSDTPLIYRTVPSWFIEVTKIKEDLVRNNSEGTYWVPSEIKTGRFHNWLTNARDWAVSRNRYWGTPIPIWISDDGEERVCVGSIEELAELSGVRVEDLHRESIDHITIPSREGRGDLKRISEVFDCWFESGSMPYAQQHYPFENREKFEGGFPADFIAEGLDQTRGWFYTLMVLSTALFNKPAFKNLIVNGLVLAADGKKMSKRLKNYPPPTDIVDEIGADALRMYLLNSPVVRAQELKFEKSGVAAVKRDVLQPWYSALRFLMLQTVRYRRTSGQSDFRLSCAAAAQSQNVTDVWLLGELQVLIDFVNQELSAYRLYTVLSRLLQLIGDLNNWYIRLNRDRLRGQDEKSGPEDVVCALSSLYVVLLNLSKVMAPFTPFFCEFLFQKLRLLGDDADFVNDNISSQAKSEGIDSRASVHYFPMPQADRSLLNEEAIAKITALQKVIECARTGRDRRGIGMKMPLKQVVIVHSDARVRAHLSDLEDYLKREINVRELVITDDEVTWCEYVATPNNKLLGKRFRREAGAVKKFIASLSHEQLNAFEESGELQFGEHKLSTEEVHVERRPRLPSSDFEGVVISKGRHADRRLVVIVDTRADDSMKLEKVARELVNRVQNMRKLAKLQMTDKIYAFLQSTQRSTAEGMAMLKAAMDANEDAIVGKLGVPVEMASAMQEHMVPAMSLDTEIEGTHVTMHIVRRTFRLASDEVLSQAFPSAPSTASLQCLHNYVGSMRPEVMQESESVSCVIDGNSVTLVRGQHFFM